MNTAKEKYALIGFDAGYIVVVKCDFIKYSHLLEYGINSFIKTEHGKLTISMPDLSNWLNTHCIKHTLLKTKSKGFFDNIRKNKILKKFNREATNNNMIIPYKEIRYLLSLKMDEQQHVVWNNSQL